MNKYELENHHNVECLEMFLSCTNLCGENYSRKDLENHKVTACALQPLECPFFSIGCGVDCNGFVCRNVFEAHVNNVSNLSDKVVAVVKNNVELTKENSELKKENFEQSKLIVDLNNENNAFDHKKVLLY
jgi:hypothetical protein